MKKKLLSLALALALCLGLMPARASAAGATLTEIVSADTYESFSQGQPDFHDGIAWLGHYDGFGCINTSGKAVVSPGTYDPVRKFSDGVAWAVRGGAWYVIDQNGNELFSYGTRATMEPDEFSEGIAKIYSKEHDRFGYIDKTGRMITPFEHIDKDGAYFQDGLTPVYNKAEAYWGYMDKTGKLAIPYQYAEARDFVNGFGAVKVGNRWTIIDTTGKDLLPEQYAYAEEHWPDNITSQVVEVYYKENNSRCAGYVNRAGQLVSGGYMTGYYAGRYVEGMVRVYENKSGNPSLGYVDESGKLAIPLSVAWWTDFRDGFALVQEKGSSSYSIIDKTGKVTGTVPMEKIGGESSRNEAAAGNGCFRIKSIESGRTRYGFVDYTGREIVACKYAHVGDFSGGVAAVSNFDNQWGFVDTNGNEIVPCTLTNVTYTNEPGIFLVKNYHGDDRASIVKSSGWTAPSTSSGTSTTPSTPSAPSNTVSATPTASTVLVNGKQTAFDAYNIDGANYFKLRDLAFVLNGTEKQFQVGWDNASKTIALTSGQGYTSVGGEMSAGASGNQSAAPSSSKLLVDGTEVSLTAYNIGGNNYFKLRDIGALFDFGIGWDNNTKTITIDTSAGYTE